MNIGEKRDVVPVLTEIDNGLVIFLNLMRKDLGRSKPAHFVEDSRLYPSSLNCLL
jgi:hypothetical protein